MSRSRNLLRSLLVIACAAGIAGFGTFSAFSSTTQNDNNKIDVGSILLEDNDAGVTPLYNPTNLEPDEKISKCITITYTGDYDASVRLYVPQAPAVNDLSQYVTLQIEPGTQAAPNMNCTGFTPDAVSGPDQYLYNGRLDTFIATHTDWTSGLPDFPGLSGASTKWTEAVGQVTYRVSVEVPSNQAAAGKSVSEHTFKWEARTQ